MRWWYGIADSMDMILGFPKQTFSPEADIYQISLDHIDWNLYLNAIHVNLELNLYIKYLPNE